MRKKALIIGAGALGLGFMAERLAADYDLCLADTGSKAESLSLLQTSRGYTLNVCSLGGIEARKVSGAFRAIVTDTAEGRGELDEALREADLVLTATGRKVLDALVPAIASSLNRRRNKGWLLFCENGRDIAATFAPQLGEQIVPVDTVMSRMCRFADAQETEYQPLWPGFGASLVVEDYGYLPLASDRCVGGPFSETFSLVSPAEFLCWEDVKFYLHNGLHAFIACLAFLQGVHFFPETPPEIREMARRVVVEEVVPALVKTHPCANKEDIEHYGLGLLKRIFNPFFNDSIDRAARGLEEKLAPGERLLGAYEFMQRAGLEPKGFARGIQAAREILARQCAKGA